MSNPSSKAPQEESLIVYPCSFPIKVMGLKHDSLLPTVTQIAHRHDPFFDPSCTELRESATGKYLGITITITATDRQQLDALYVELSGHELIKVVL